MKEIKEIFGTVISFFKMDLKSSIATIFVIFFAITFFLIFIYKPFFMVVYFIFISIFLFVICNIISNYMLKKIKENQEEKIKIDEICIEKYIKDKLVERILWKDIIKISFQTKALKPYIDDSYYILTTQNNKNVILKNEAAIKVGLFYKFQKLPGFDNAEFRAACFSNVEALFVCWAGQSGEAVFSNAPEALVTDE